MILDPTPQNVELEPEQQDIVFKVTSSSGKNEKRGSYRSANDGSRSIPVKTKESSDEQNDSANTVQSYMEIHKDRLGGPSFDSGIPSANESLRSRASASTPRKYDQHLNADIDEIENSP